MSRRILIVRLSALGDTALTLPLLFALRRHEPDAHIGWVVGERAAPLLRGLPQLDRLHIHGGGLAGLRSVVSEIRGLRYDISLDPQGLTKSAVIPWLAGIPVRVGLAPGRLEGRELAPWLTNRAVKPPAERTHASARYLWLAEGIGISPPESVPVSLPRDPRAESAIDAWWASSGIAAPAMAFGFGAGWPTRVWPVSKVAVLVDAARERGYACVGVWGPMEAGRVDAWRACLGDRVAWPPATDVPQMIALLRHCRRYAGPDSAPLHLAWLLGKPTFSWYGASDPARSAPPGPVHAFVARGPHDWRRRGAGGLDRLAPEEALPVFRGWLGGAGATEASGNPCSTVQSLGEG